MRNVKSIVLLYTVFHVLKTFYWFDTCKTDLSFLIAPGGIDIVALNWIPSIALPFPRYFIGTSVSTFSFRIHEEREILGFDPKTTYNRFCGDSEKECEQPTHWKIVYWCNDVAPLSTALKEHANCSVKVELCYLYIYIWRRTFTYT